MQIYNQFGRSGHSKLFLHLIVVILSLPIITLVGCGKKGEQGSVGPAGINNLPKLISFPCMAIGLNDPTFLIASTIYDCTLCQHAIFSVFSDSLCTTPAGLGPFNLTMTKTCDISVIVGFATGTGSEGISLVCS